MKNERHPFDPFSFVFGTFFAAIGGAFAFTDLDTIDLSISGAISIGLLLVGGLLLALVWRRARREVSPEIEPAESPSTPSPTR